MTSYNFAGYRIYRSEKLVKNNVISISHYNLTSFLHFGHKILNFRYHLGIIGLRPGGRDQLLVPLTSGLRGPADA